MIVRALGLAILAAAVGAMAGCGMVGGSSVEATGAVTLDGNPLANASVQLIPESNASLGTQAATTDAKGAFTVRTVSSNTPFKPGKYVAIVSKLSGSGMDNMKNEVPAMYNKQQTTPFKVEIVEGKNELKPFAMTTKQMR